MPRFSLWVFRGNFFLLIGVCRRQSEPISPSHFHLSLEPGGT
jgi:hypothetical protein